MFTYTPGRPERDNSKCLKLCEMRYNSSLGIFGWKEFLKIQKAKSVFTVYTT